MLVLHSTPTTTTEPTQSTSERARERYLKQDPLAIVLSPSSVECRQCKRKIKLSSKSAYDPFHWRNHRARCIKAHNQKPKPAVKATVTSKASTSVCHHYVFFDNFGLRPLFDYLPSFFFLSPQSPLLEKIFDSSIESSTTTSG